MNGSGADLGSVRDRILFDYPGWYLPIKGGGSKGCERDIYLFSNLFWPWLTSSPTHNVNSAHFNRA